MNERDLLQSYVQTGSEEAFAALVALHVDLVYSAALRQVRSPQLAEEIAQSVFTDLARSALKLKADTNLSAWLYQVTRRTAIDTIRRESRRQLREHIAQEMSEMNLQSSDWSQIEPLLDEAMAELEPADRTALLLRYFQNKTLREVGQSLGTSDDAAQKRVSRAVERLREIFSRHGVTVGAGSLALLLSANAIQSAPIGLTATLSAGAALSGAAAHATTTLGITKAITMTTLQKALIAATVAACVGIGIYEIRRASVAELELQSLRQQQNPLTDQVHQLAQEKDDANQKLEFVRQELEQLRQANAGLLRLRAENARLRTASQNPGSSKTNGSNIEADGTESALKAWLSRVDLLKQRFEKAPDQKIPEFQLLTEQDWLNATKGNLDNEKDYRAEMSDLRGSAQRAFASVLQPAMRKYLEVNNQLVPTDVAQLQSFFDPPILQRYAVQSADSVPNVRVGSEWILTQKALIDEDYDARLVIGPTGFGSTSARSPGSANAMIALAPALKAFAAANNGQEPSDPAQLQPYLKTPAEQEALQQISKAVKEQDGR